MKNRLTDLNDHLFAQLERLADEDLTPEQIELESKRGSAMVAVAELRTRKRNVEPLSQQLAIARSDREARPTQSARLVIPMTTQIHFNSPMADILRDKADG